MSVSITHVLAQAEDAVDCIVHAANCKMDWHVQWQNVSPVVKRLVHHHLCQTGV